jgi:hypothetical protein
VNTPVATRWEFWPAWTLYVPLAPYFFWLALRHGGLARFTAANPGIPMGGVVGESKCAILRHLAGPHALPMLPLDLSTPAQNQASGPDAGATRVVTVPQAETHAPSSCAAGSVQAWMEKNNITYPIIIKPDIGERGVGVRLLHNAVEVAGYLYSCTTRNAHALLLAQAFHPGPGEAGIFYTRFPNEPRGTIFSITDKVFPAIIGDGKLSIAGLIDADARLRLQRSVFRARWSKRLEEVPIAGERIVLANAGNHCQGTKFVDGSHLKTPALEAAIDVIAQQIPGFYFGRLDIRYTTADALKAGRGLAVVEVNGVLSESTNMYDPANSYFSGLATLARQWELAFRIGGMNARNGALVPRVFTILKAVKNHLRRAGAGEGAD